MLDSDIAGGERINRIGIRRGGIRQYFDFVLTSRGFGKAKPDEAIFKEALLLGEARNPEDAAHVGDDLEKDVIGARKIGMHGILLSRFNSPKVPGETSIKSLEDLFASLSFVPQ